MLRDRFGSPELDGEALRAQLETRSMPRWVGANVEKVLAARGTRARMKRVFDSSLVPMILVDDERRHVEVNTPARLVFRLTLAELRLLRIDDLTPEHRYPRLKAAWARLLSSGCVAGPYEIASPDGSRLDIAYYALANALPGLHLIAFAPAAWPDEELLSDTQQWLTGELSPLTPRELEVLQLAAEGRNAPVIAEELVVSVATVRSHFGNIYAKLRVGDRAAAVAKGMRLGLIA
jgi:DNA-binding CsgD family transcriptional regulator